MKHKVVVALCLIAVFVLGIVASNTWHTQEVQSQVKAAKAAASQQYRDAKRQAAVAAERKRVNDECHRLQANYDIQPAPVKKTTSRPECDLQMVQ